MESAVNGALTFPAPTSNVSNVSKGSRRATFGAAILAAVYFAILAATANDVGFTRDEGYYFKAAQEYFGFFDTLFSSRFFEAFSDQEIQRHLSYNTEHPPLVKFAQGFTHRLFHDWLGWTSNAQGFRMAGFLFAALSVFATFLLGRAVASSAVGLVAAVGLAIMPRYFFDAHLACFDVPITAVWTLALFTFYRAISAEQKILSKAIVAGLAFGIALGTKLNALFLPVIFVLVWLLARPRKGGSFFWVRSPSGGLDLALPRLPKVLPVCAILGPLVLVATWPHLWHDTFRRIGAYIGFHLHHEHYPALYFHDLLVAPPFPSSFPFVMSLFTVPSPILALGCLGFCLSMVRAVRFRQQAEVLLVLALLVPILLIALPGTPKFGGVKHWYNALPALSIFAATILVDSVRYLASRLSGFSIFSARNQFIARVPAGASWSLGLALFVLPGVLGCIYSHPNGIGFYNEIAGGFRGGAELGMQRGFWGGLARPLYEDFFDLNLRPGTRVFFNRTNYDSYLMYRRDGIISDSIGYANEAKSADIGVAFEQPEHASQEGAIWANFGGRPYDGVYQDNVTLVQIYRRNAPF